MTLKELAETVNKNIADETWGVDLIDGENGIPMMMPEEIEDACSILDPLDENDIRNINKTFWEADITPANEMLLESMVAHCLFLKCKTEADMKSTLGWLTELDLNVCTPIVKKLNCRSSSSKGKKNIKDWRYGEFTKFDLISKYGFLYDDEDQANTDANDKTTTCPLIMGIINSGWHNIQAVEDTKTGKIVISKRSNVEGIDDCDMFLTAVRSQFETIYNTAIEFAAYKLDNGLQILRKAHKRTEGESCSDSMNGYHNNSKKYLDDLATALFNEEYFPQDVYDFRSVNTQFLEVVANAFDIIDNLKSSQHDLARKLYANTLDNMKQMADFECLITREQYLRDPATKDFIKPRFDCELLGYCGILQELLCYLECMYEDVIMRLPPMFHKPIDFHHPLTAGIDENFMDRKYCDMRPKLERELILNMSAK